MPAPKLYLSWCENADGEHTAHLNILSLHVYCRYDVGGVQGQTTWITKVCVNSYNGSRIVLFRSEYCPRIGGQSDYETLERMALAETEAKYIVQRLLVDAVDMGLDDGWSYG